MRKSIFVLLFIIPFFLQAQESGFHGYGDIIRAQQITIDTFELRIVFTGGNTIDGQYIVDSLKINDKIFSSCAPYTVVSISLQTSGIAIFRISDPYSKGMPTLGSRCAVYRETTNKNLVRTNISNAMNYGISPNELNCLTQNLISQIDTLMTSEEITLWPQIERSDTTGAIAIAGADSIGTWSDSLRFWQGVLRIGVDTAATLDDVRTLGFNETGTANTLPLWATTTTLGDSWLSQSGNTLSLATTRLQRFIGHTTAGRPTGVAGLFGFNTTLSNLELHDGTEWKSILALPSLAAYQIPYANSSGVLKSSSELTYNENTNTLEFSSPGASVFKFTEGSTGKGFKFTANNSPRITEPGNPSGGSGWTWYLSWDTKSSSTGAGIKIDRWGRIGFGNDLTNANQGSTTIETSFLFTPRPDATKSYLTNLALFLTNESPSRNGLYIKNGTIGSFNYEFNAEQDTTGLDGNVLTFNSGTGLIELQAAPSGADDWGADVVNSDNTLTGPGTVGSPLKVDTSIIVTITALNDSIAAAATTDTNLGISDITFTGARTHALGSNTLTFDATAANDILVLDGSTGDVGILGIPVGGAALAVGGTESMIIPSGTTAQEPTPQTGMIRHDATKQAMTGYQDGDFRPMLQTLEMVSTTTGATIVVYKNTFLYCDISSTSQTITLDPTDLSDGSVVKVFVTSQNDLTLDSDTGSFFSTGAGFAATQACTEGVYEVVWDGTNWFFYKIS